MKIQGFFIRKSRKSPSWGVYGGGRVLHSTWANPPFIKGGLGPEEARALAFQMCKRDNVRDAKFSDGILEMQNGDRYYAVPVRNGVVRAVALIDPVLEALEQKLEDGLIA